MKYSCTPYPDVLTLFKGLENSPEMSMATKRKMSTKYKGKCTRRHRESTCK